MRLKSSRQSPFESATVEPFITSLSQNSMVCRGWAVPEKAMVSSIILPSPKATSSDHNETTTGYA